jgi:hypothetical protein
VRDDDCFGPHRVIVPPGGPRGCGPGRARLR